MASFIPTDEEWEKMKKHIKGDKYKKEDFFVFETLAVGDKIVPNRYMRLMPDLLLTMKEDAEKGVSLMLNHNWSQYEVQSIPIGKVFDARIAEGTQKGEETALYTKQYILRDDSKVDGYSKNDIINLIESGILADTSVGWGTTSESYKCSICGNSIYDWEKCKHFPGEKYIVNEETNEVKECIIEAHSPREKHAGNNVLMENSIVFDGAYPNAIIQSAVGEEIETPSGKFKRIEGKQELSNNEVVYGYSTTGGNVNLLYKPNMEKGGKENMQIKDDKEKLDNAEGTDTGVNINDTKVDDTKETVNNTQDVKEDITDKEVKDNEGKTELSVDEEILQRFGNICETVEELVKMAKEGLSNRKEKIEEALESGVHSMGNNFNKEIFQKTFSNMETKDIIEMGKEWEKQSKEKFSNEKVSKQDFSKEKEEVDEVRFKNFKQFKTDIY